MKVGWISIGNHFFGSTRMGVLNIHDAFLEKGIESVVLNTNKIFKNDTDVPIAEIKKRIVEENITVCVIHKICNQDMHDLISFCRERKIKTVFTNGDWSDTDIYTKVDHILAGSPYMQKELIKRHCNKNTHYIDDCLEIPENTPLKIHEDTSNIKLCWFGNFMKLPYAVKFIKNLDPNLELTTVSNSQDYSTEKSNYIMGAGTGKPWDTSWLIDFLLREIDVIVIPIDLSDGDLLKHYAKTANRVTFPIALGIPVIATPIPSYEIVIKNNINGFLCKTETDWLKSFNILKNKESREKIGKHSSTLVRKEFGKDNIIQKYINIFRS